MLTLGQVSACRVFVLSYGTSFLFRKIKPALFSYLAFPPIEIMCGETALCIFPWYILELCVSEFCLASLSGRLLNWPDWLIPVQGVIKKLNLCATWNMYKPCFVIFSDARLVFTLLCARRHFVLVCF